MEAVERTASGGSTGLLVVYADNHRMLLRTPKKDPDSAESLWSYTQRRLGKGHSVHSGNSPSPSGDDNNTMSSTWNVLKWLDFKTVRLWTQLLWLDSNNFGGAFVKPDTTSTPSGSESNAAVLAGQWAMARFFPETMQAAFKTILDQYLFIYCTPSNHLATKRTETDKNIQKTSSNIMLGASFLDGIGEDEDELMNGSDNNCSEEFSKALMPASLTRKIMTLSRELWKHWHYHGKTEEPFPVILGRTLLDAFCLPSPSSSSSNNAFMQSTRGAVEPVALWINAVCGVLSMERRTRPKVHSLRQACFALLNTSSQPNGAVGVCSPWDPALICMHNPCKPALLLPDIVCGGCGGVGDVDFVAWACRMQSTTNDKSSSSANLMPTCLHCSQLLDADVLAGELCGMAMKALIAHQTADLECSKCGRQAERNLLPSTCPVCTTAPWTLLAHNFSSNRYSSGAQAEIMLNVVKQVVCVGKALGMPAVKALESLLSKQ